MVDRRRRREATLPRVAGLDYCGVCSRRQGRSPMGKPFGARDAYEERLSEKLGKDDPGRIVSSENGRDPGRTWAWTH